MLERLIDLHVDWLLQYAPETTLFRPELYPGVAARLGQSDGYLGATKAAVLACYRSVLDWASQGDPWRALGDLITRLEAEFCGRLLMGAEDFARWKADFDGLTWGVIGVKGFDSLIRSSNDLSRLPSLFDRGVRVFQPVSSGGSVLGGSAAIGDERGLTELGREFLEALVAISSDSRPILDIAHLNPRTMADVLNWFEEDGLRIERLLLVYSHGAPATVGFSSPRAISELNLKRLRALGGSVGFTLAPPFFDSADEVRLAIERTAEIPFRGSAGYDGIAIGTDFLGIDRVIHGMENAPRTVAWLVASYDPATARNLMCGNAESLVAAALLPPSGEKAI